MNYFKLIGIIRYAMVKRNMKTKYLNSRNRMKLKPNKIMKKKKLYYPLLLNNKIVNNNYQML